MTPTLPIRNPQKKGMGKLNVKIVQTSNIVYFVIDIVDQLLQATGSDIVCMGVKKVACYITSYISK